jgi:hypothetical protein
MRFPTISVLVGVAAGALAMAASAQPNRASRSDQALIRSAITAAPRAVGAHAAVVAINADGTMRSLRAGGNGFTCMADNPASPGPDPMCMDSDAMAWAMAWISHRPPPADSTGLMYMLAGGADGSNTDPYAARPAPGNGWVHTGPHLMIVGSPSLLRNYPSAATPDTSQPYVMWAGTPYAHLMIPVR